MKKQLLCTFSPRASLSLTMDYVSTFYKISNNKIYLYSEEYSSDNYILFYNIEDNIRGGLAKHTILVHRKVQSNSFYTINALNALIKRVNNGVLDKSYQVDWDSYSNTLLIIKEGNLEMVSIVFEKSLYL